MNFQKFSMFGGGSPPRNNIFHRKTSAIINVILVLHQLFILCSDAYYLDGDPYRQKQILGPKASYVVEWSVNWKENSITFQVSAETKGWVGFGLSRDGRMTNSDVIIGGVAPSGKPYFDDAHVLGNRSIQIDGQQDWKLIGAWEKGKRTYLTVKRALQTCDSDDFQITKDLVFLIWAYGLDDEVAYHNKLRGSTPVYLLDPQISDEIAHDHYRQLGPHSNLYLVQRWALTNTLKLEPKPTTVWCSVQRGPKLLSRHDIVGMGALLPTRMARRHVQQLRVFKCASPQQTDAESFFEPYVKIKGEECYMNERRTFPLGFCRELVYVHGRGGQPFYFPEEIGIPIGESRAEYFLLETTYDNPKTVPNLEIEAGVEIIFSHRQKPNAASLIQVGYGSFGTFMLPPKSVMSIYGSCGPSCTSTMFPKDGVNVFAAMLQTRSLGRKIRLRHFREDQELKWILKDDNYDSEYQQMRLLHHDVTLFPGDQLTTQCTFNSYSRNRTSFSGFSTQDEICTAYMYVSKRIPFFSCTSEYPQENLLSKYGIKNVTWDLTWQERYVTEPQELEGVWLGDIVDHKAHVRSVNHDQLQNDFQYNQHLESCPNIRDIMSASQSKVFRTFTNDWTMDEIDPIEARTEYLTSTVSYPQNVNKEYRDAPFQCKQKQTAAPPPVPQRPRPVVSQPFSTLPERPTGPSGPPPDSHNPHVDYSIPRERPLQRLRPVGDLTLSPIPEGPTGPTGPSGPLVPQRARPVVSQPFSTLPERPTGPSGPPPVSHNSHVDYSVPRERPLQRLRPVGDTIPKGPTGPPPTRRPSSPSTTPIVAQKFENHIFDNPFQEGYFDSLEVHPQPLKPPYKEIIFSPPEAPLRNFQEVFPNSIPRPQPQAPKRPTATPPSQAPGKSKLNSSREQMLNKINRRPTPQPSPPPFEDLYRTPTKRPLVQYFDEQLHKNGKKPTVHYFSNDDHLYNNPIQRPPAEEQSQRQPEKNPVLEYFEELSNRKPPSHSSKEQISPVQPTKKPSLHYHFDELPYNQPHRPSSEDHSRTPPTKHPVIQYFENLQNNRKPPTQSSKEQSYNQQRHKPSFEEQSHQPPVIRNPTVEYNFDVPQNNRGPPALSSKEQSYNQQRHKPSFEEQSHQPPAIRNPAVEYNFKVPQNNRGPPPSSKEQSHRRPTDRPTHKFNVGEPFKQSNERHSAEELRNQKPIQTPHLQHEDPRPSAKQQPRLRANKKQSSRRPTEKPPALHYFEERPYHKSSPDEDPIQQSIYFQDIPTKKSPPPRSSEEQSYKSRPASKPSLAYFEEPSYQPDKQPVVHYTDEGPYRLPKIPHNRPEPEPNYDDKIKITHSQYSEESPRPKPQPPSINSIEEPRRLKRPRLYYSDDINLRQPDHLPAVRDSQETAPRKLKRITIYSSENSSPPKTRPSKKSSSEERHRRPRPRPEDEHQPYNYEPLEESPRSREPIQEHHPTAALPSPKPQSSHKPQKPRKPSSPPSNLKLILGNSIFNKPSDITIPVVQNTNKNTLFGAVGKNVVGDQQSFLKFFEQLANVFTPNSRSNENQSLELARTIASLKEGISVQNLQQLSRRSGVVEEKKPPKNNIKLLILQQTKHD